MVTSARLANTYGDPSVDTAKWEPKNMQLWVLPPPMRIAIPALPARIYCHRRFKPVLERWFEALIAAGVHGEIKTYDGCWNVRKKRGLASLSIHAWGMAVDLNASHNPLGLTREQCVAKGLKPFSAKFIAASRPHVDCGADWTKRPDLMHFQIKATDV